MSDTPRTDAAVFNHPSCRHLVSTDFARQLERELAEAKADAAASEMMLKQVCNERDSLRAENRQKDQRC